MTRTRLRWVKWGAWTSLTNQHQRDSWHQCYGDCLGIHSLPCFQCLAAVQRWDENLAMLTTSFFFLGLIEDKKLQSGLSMTKETFHRRRKVKGKWWMILEVLPDYCKMSTTRKHCSYHIGLLAIIVSFIFYGQLPPWKQPIQYTVALLETLCKMFSQFTFVH